MFEAGVMSSPASFFVAYSPKTFGSRLFMPLSVQRFFKMVLAALSSRVVLRNTTMGSFCQVRLKFQSPLPLARSTILQLSNT